MFLEVFWFLGVCIFGFRIADFFRPVWAFLSCLCIVFRGCCVVVNSQAICIFRRCGVRLSPSIGCFAVVYHFLFVSVYLCKIQCLINFGCFKKIK